MVKRLTTVEFVNRARRVHKDRYDYSKSTYLNARTKITITCREHGEFKQSTHNHLGGHGCPVCSGRKIAESATETFILRSQAVHGDRYDYSKSVYVNAHQKVSIMCHEHGEFHQAPRHHVDGANCPSCVSESQRMSLQSFIDRAEGIHGDRYNYSKSVYTNIDTKVTITCHDHGDFEQVPYSHLQGQGCMLCNGYESRRRTTASFINEAHAVHDGRYVYSKSEYVNNVMKVTITCPDHGDFDQSAGSHLSGSGCPYCAHYGYQPSRTGYLYFLIDTETYSHVKVGITNNPEQRFKTLRRNTPFTFEPLEILEMTGEDAPRLEKFLHNELTSARLSGFDGATEWMCYDGEVIQRLIKSHDH
ncbi:hypothetical protein NVP1033O_88 [Vibrio phage 1.033.O._10N.222.49.B8]|nr:hypothetical protein NVP1033O_88 [Vibrio phage 1.033.O._10N.222.49.B8]